jgi:uncharacterized protein (TIGR02001 family)
MHISKPRQIAMAIALATPAMALPIAAHAGATGNIGVVSKYILRGIGNENTGAALQGGFDYSHESGLYLGWWGSSLGYEYNNDGNDYTTNGFENDFYGGFAGSAGDFNYKVGVIQYYYVNVDDSNLTEAVLGVGYGPVGLQAQYLVTDGWWGNSGDIYWTLNYGTDLPASFKFAASLGWYTYDDDDNKKLCNPDPAGCGITTADSEFRHLNLTLSHPIGKTGADMSLTYIVAGKDRAKTQYDDTMVFGITYGFDI